MAPDLMNSIVGVVKYPIQALTTFDEVWVGSKLVRKIFQTNFNTPTPISYIFLQV